MPNFNPNSPKSFCYVNWDFPNIKIDSLTFEVTFKTEIPDLPGLYFQFYDGGINQDSKYFGFQTQIDGGIGRGMLYSRWGSRDHRLGRKAEGSILIDSGHEGDFISLRKSYRWSKGTYLVELKVVDFDDQGQWYGVSWFDKRNHKLNEIGSLYFPNGNGIHNGCGTWLELYTPTYRPENLPFLEYMVDCIANGSVRPKFVRIAYKPEETDNANVLIRHEGVLIQAGNGVMPLTPAGRYPR